MKKRGSCHFGSVNHFHGSYSSSKVINSLKVFQAGPLVWHDEEGNPHPIPIIDFDYEKRQLNEWIWNGYLKIDISYDIASPERLQNFLSRGDGARALHFSCHGHPDYLAIEDGWGAMHQLPVKNLKEWICAGGNNLLFVFVSACHSRSAGEAFLKAGVKHVVCCQRDDQPIHNSIAIYFARAFYQALANGKRLDEAFELARQSVKNCPGLDKTLLQSEVEKYILLPEEGVDHNIYIFEQPDPKKGDMHSANPQSCTSKEEKIRSCIVNSDRIPIPSHIFEGRQVDMYHILHGLKSNVQLVRVIGSEVGVGRCSLVLAVCQYIQQRKHTMCLSRYSEILWLPCQQEERNDHLSEILGYVSLFFKSNQGVKHNKEYERQFINYLRQNTYKVLVIDARKSLYPEFSKRVVSFIQKIIKTTRTYIIMIQNSENDRDGSDLFYNFSCVERDVIVKNLDFASTVHLFGKLCQHITKRHYIGVSNYLEFSSLLLPKSTAYQPCRSYRGRRIFKMLGEGIPAKIHHAAKTMTINEYSEMISLALRKERIFEFESRADIDRKSSTLASEVAKAIKEKRFIDAQEYQEQFDEIEIFRENFLDYSSLVSLAHNIQIDQQRAVKTKDFLRAQRLQEKFDALQEQMMTERNAMKRLGFKVVDQKFLVGRKFREQDDTSRDTADAIVHARNDVPKEEEEKSSQDIVNNKTRVKLEAQIEFLERDLLRTSEKNDFDYRKVQSQVTELKQKLESWSLLEDLLPSLAQVKSCMNEFMGMIEELEKKTCKETRSIDASVTGTDKQWKKLNYKNDNIIPSAYEAPGRASEPQRQHQSLLRPRQQLQQTYHEEEITNYTTKECIITFLDGNNEIEVEKEAKGFPLELYIKLLKSQYEELKTSSDQTILTRCIVDTIINKLPNVKFFDAQKSLNSYMILSALKVDMVTYTILISGIIYLLEISLLSDQNNDDDSNILNDASNKNLLSIENDKVNESFLKDFEKDSASVTLQKTNSGSNMSINEYKLIYDPCHREKSDYTTVIEGTKDRRMTSIYDPCHVIKVDNIPTIKISREQIIGDRKDSAKKQKAVFPQYFPNPATE